jgi:RND superfamily putative drug exporter
LMASLAIGAIANNVPSNLIASLGVAPTDLVNQLYSLGPSPNEAALVNYTIALSESSFAGMLNSSGAFPVSQLMYTAYMLGSSPSLSQVHAVASGFVAEATQIAFSESPLFSVNSTSLTALLTDISENATATKVDEIIRSSIANQSFMDYPFVPTNAVLKNYVSQDNSSMLVVLSFSSEPNGETISSVKSDVQVSGLDGLGSVYLTGAAVVTHDVQDVFEPAFTLTVGPGIVFALLIVGLLFWSPVSAFLPVLMGGISTEISLAATYVVVVGLEHGNITFLTPTLTVLLTLGLSVDYAVLQLRRTREERQLGKSVEESVGISIKWAGQAVLTAGITVIIAYIVMALANVPIFSNVAEAIALAVAILLAVSLTLLPSLEIVLGDRAFWPMSKSSRASDGKNRLKRLAEKVLKRKVLIVAVICVLAIGAFYVEYSTPTGLDFLKLIPNFPSNQGITVVTNTFGSGTISPTSIVVTTPTMITYGANEFNQTLLDQIEQISTAAASSNGTVSVTSPTRPFGAVFNYSSIGNLSEPLWLQYNEGMLRMIGNDNKTALITVGFSNPAESPEAMSSLVTLKSNVGNVSLLDGVTVDFGGSTQSTYDSQTFIANLLPEVVAILSAAVFVILFFQLRSVFTPIRLVFTILCSVVFSLALLSLIFYVGLGLPILDFAPLFVVVTMLGVGIDYDIFFVTRIREEALMGKTDDEAIKIALDKVWVTIIGLGFVLSTVFASLLITGIAILQEISLTISAAILIDVLVVIPFFVPSLMGLAQRFNWWPSRIRRTQQSQDAKQRESS